MGTVDMGGFLVDGSTAMTMIVMFVLYSAVIIGLGMFVKYSTSHSTGSKLSSFITGNGNMNALELGMTTAALSMAGGVMVGNPGLEYNVGFIHTFCMCSFFLSSFVILGTFGKKLPIMRQRTDANTISQLMYHRFQSKAVVSVLAVCATVFLAVLAGGQTTSAARMFSVISGGHYNVGLVIALIAVAIYTFSGGVKSLARVSVVQGFIMLITVVAIGIAAYRNIDASYGSLQEGLEMIKQTESASVLTNGGWTPMYALGMIVVNSWSASGIPATLQSNMYYEDAKTAKRGLLIGLSVNIVIMSVMSICGVLARVINPNLTTPDLTVIYIATSFLPSWIAGVVICGIFAAIQSSLAGFMIYAAASIANDLYKGVINPDADEKTVEKINKTVVLLVVLAAAAIAIHPVSLIQILLVFGTGCLGAAYIFPTFLGAYWKKATRTGALAGVICGPLFYILSYFASSHEWYVTYCGNIHPAVVSAAASLIGVVVGSLLSQNSKVCKGVFEVWFCEDYDEKFARTYDNGKTFQNISAQ